VRSRSDLVFAASLLMIGCGAHQAPVAAAADPSGPVYEESELDRPANPITIPMPEYPDDLRSVGAPGRVRLEYVVGSDGRVEPATIRVVEATQPAFAQAAVKAIRDALFHPGVKDGRYVRAQVKQVIAFNISSH
jgi:protein TonB